MKLFSRPLLAALAALALISACQKAEPVSTTDPLPFPSDERKDRSVAPGENFFLYCNGSWLKTAVIPEGKKIYGGIYIPMNQVRDRKAQFLETDPVLSRIMAMGKEADAREKNKAYIEKLKGSVPKPENATLEDYYRLIGKLYREGLEDLITIWANITDDGRISPDIITMFLDDIAPDEGPAPEPGIPKTKQFLDLLCSGLRIGPETATVANPDSDPYAKYMSLDKKDVYDSLMSLFDNMDMEPEDFTSSLQSASSMYIEYLFAETYAKGVKEKYTPVAERLRAQFRKRMESLDWMSDATRTKAIEKLDAMNINVGYPDNWHTDIFPTLEKVNSCSCFLEAYMLMRGGKNSFLLELAGLPVKEHLMEDWIASGKSLSEIQSSYSNNTNSVFINNSILIPPLFRDDVTEAYNYASLSIFAHEMTHGFDADGAKRDKDGKQVNWWTVADKMAFEDRQKLLVDCYNHLELAPDIVPGKYCNGEVTLEENTADLGGLNIAFDAYTEHLQEQGYFGEVLKEQQRKFFECYADIWCCKYGKAWIDKETGGERPDPHALPQERVNGVVMNIDAWYDLYNVTRENNLYLPPEKRTRIW